MPREYDYSPPRRGYSPDRSDRGRGSYGGRSARREEKTSLLVRNIPRTALPNDLRKPFEQFGPIKDVYLPKDYYTGEPRGFGFVQYLSPADASEAQYHLDRTMFDGREITVVFAEENRKRPQDMRFREPPRGGGGYSRRSHYSRSRSRSPRRYSRSPPPRRYSRSPLGRASPPPRSPARKRSPPRNLSPPPRDRSPVAPDRSPVRRDRSPGMSDGASPVRRDRFRSRDVSPAP